MEFNFSANGICFINLLVQHDGFFSINQCYYCVLENEAHYFLHCLHFSCGNATATKIILSANATELRVGETIKFHIEIYPSKMIGGTFSLSQETSPGFFKTLPENFCKADEDCACGKSKVTGECFYGNKIYVNALEQCPDFCISIAGNFEIRCVKNKCKQVQIEEETTCSTCAYSWLVVAFIIAIFILLIIISFIHKKKKK